MRGNGQTQAIPSKELIREVNSLKTQLKRVSDAIASDANDGLDAAESKGRATIEEAIEAAQRLIDGYAESAKDTASRLARRSAEMRDNAADSLVETVQARPFGTLAAVIGIGFLAGYLCRRSN